MPTINRRVNASTDDGHHAIGTPHAYSNSTPFQTIGNQVSVFSTGIGFFCRFDRVTVPKNANITAAHIALKSAATLSAATCRVVVEAEDADDPTAVVDDADWHALIRTTASVTWNPVPGLANNEEINTPSLVDIVQELVDRVGWTPTNAMQFLIHDDAELSDANAYRLFDSYNADPNTAPLLVVTYDVVVPARRAILLVAG